MKKQLIAVAIASALALAGGVLAADKEMEAVVTVTKFDPATRTVQIQTKSRQAELQLGPNIDVSNVQEGNRYHRLRGKSRLGSRHHQQAGRHHREGGRGEQGVHPAHDEGRLRDLHDRPRRFGGVAQDRRGGHGRVPAAGRVATEVEPAAGKRSCPPAVSPCRLLWKEQRDDGRSEIVAPAKAGAYSLSEFP